MMYRMFPLAALVLALIASGSAMAAKNAPNTHDGKFVSGTDNKLVMTGLNGTEYTHALATGVTLTLDNKTCQIDDIKGGMRIRVTLNTDATPQVTRIEALDKNPDFEARN